MAIRNVESWAKMDVGILKKNSPRPSLPLPTSLTVSLDQDVKLEALFAVETISAELSHSSEKSNPLNISIL